MDKVMLGDNHVQCRKCTQQGVLPACTCSQTILGLTGLLPVPQPPCLKHCSVSPPHHPYCTASNPGCRDNPLPGWLCTAKPALQKQLFKPALGLLAEAYSILHLSAQWPVCVFTNQRGGCSMQFCQGKKRCSKKSSSSCKQALGIK